MGDSALHTCHDMRMLASARAPGRRMHLAAAFGEVSARTLACLHGGQQLGQLTHAALSHLHTYMHSQSYPDPCREAVAYSGAMLTSLQHFRTNCTSASAARWQNPKLGMLAVEGGGGGTELEPFGAATCTPLSGGGGVIGGGGTPGGGGGGGEEARTCAPAIGAAAGPSAAVSVAFVLLCRRHTQRTILNKRPRMMSAHPCASAAGTSALMAASIACWPGPDGTLAAMAAGISSSAF